jgi:hypothetical protein
MMGVGPDDTVYIMLARPVSTPAPAPTSAFSVPDVLASVIALRPDGTPKPGWPTAGVAVEGWPYDFAVGDDGTVYFAGGVNLYGANGKKPSSLIVTAIGSNGRIVAGWPYRSPAAIQTLVVELLVVGRDKVCFTNRAPNSTATSSDVPTYLYCLGLNGKLLPGWPYKYDHLLSMPAIGPDGTVYVEQVQPTTGSGNWPDHVVALGPDGKPKAGWTTWSPPDFETMTRILPAPDGRVYMLVGGDSQAAKQVIVDGNGHELSNRSEVAGGGRPTYEGVVLSPGGSLFVSTSDGPAGYLVTGYDSQGAPLSGWPVLAGGSPSIAPTRDGFVWLAWPIYSLDGKNDTSVVELFNAAGQLQTGYPMESRFIVTYHELGLYLASNGTAYANSSTTTAITIVAFDH